MGWELTLSDAEHVLSLTAVDGRGQAGSADVAIVPTADEAPWCEVSAPGEGDVFEVEDSVPLSAEAGDVGTAANALTVVISSDLDGVLWEGAPDSSGAVERTLTLSEGAHYVQLVVTDERDQTGSCGVGVVIDPCADADVQRRGRRLRRPRGR